VESASTIAVAFIDGRVRQMGLEHIMKEIKTNKKKMQGKIVQVEPELPNVFQQFSQLRSIGFSKGQAQSIVQLHEHIAIRRQMELLDMVEIHDRIAMNPEKTIRVEQCLEVFHALPNQM
jgi:hypothetical protein